MSVQLLFLIGPSKSSSSPWKKNANINEFQYLNSQSMSVWKFNHNWYVPIMIEFRYRHTLRNSMRNKSSVKHEISIEVGVLHAKDKRSRLDCPIDMTQHNTIRDDTTPYDTTQHKKTQNGIIYFFYFLKKNFWKKFWKKKFFFFGIS